MQSLPIELTAPWDNGYVQSFNCKLRDELLAREVFDTLFDANVLTDQWLRHHNTA